MKQDAIAVIMAGGKSSRMGKDKALLPFGNENSLAEFQYRRLSKLFSKVYISAKSNKFDFNVEIIEDRYIEASPLVALVSIFESLEVEEVFILSVDAPFVDEETIKNLYREAESGFDVIIAESNSGLEPLCAIYRKGFLKEAKKFLMGNNHRLHTLLKTLDIKKVKVDKKDVFMNLNYPSEYREAKRLKK